MAKASSKQLERTISEAGGGGAFRSLDRGLQLHQQTQCFTLGLPREVASGLNKATIGEGAGKGDNQVKN